MKSLGVATFLFLAASLAVESFNALLWGQDASIVIEKDRRPTLTVTGTGKVKCKPDAAYVVLDVTASDGSLDEVRRKNEKMVAQVMEGIGKVGKLRVQLGTPTVMEGAGPGAPPPGPMAEAPKPDQPAPKEPAKQPAKEPAKTYSLSRSLTVLVENPEHKQLQEEVDQIILNAVAAGGRTGIAVQTGGGFQFGIGGFNIGGGFGGTTPSQTGVTYFRRDYTDYQRQARKEAVRDAVANGQATADGAGLQLTELISISDGSDFGMPLNSGVTPQVDAMQDIEVTVSVRATFRYAGAK